MNLATLVLTVRPEGLDSKRNLLTTLTPYQRVFLLWGLCVSYTDQIFKSIQHRHISPWRSGQIFKRDLVTQEHLLST